MRAITVSNTQNGVNIHSILASFEPYQGLITITDVNGNYMSFTPGAVSIVGTGINDYVIFLVAFATIIGDIPTSTGDGTICFSPAHTIGFTAAGDLYTYNSLTSANIILPVGADDYVLTADSSEGNGIKWAASTGGDVSVSGTPANNQITVWTNASTVEGDADLTWNGAILTVAGTANIDSTQIANANSGGTLSSAGDYGAGSQIYRDSGFSNVQAGKIYYATGTGTWALASSGSEAAASGLLAIATGTNSLDGMLLNGIVKLPTNITGTIGDKIYLSGPAGSFTTALPSTAGSFVRIVGHLINATDDTIYFNPSNDYIELV